MAQKTEEYREQSDSHLTLNKALFRRIKEEIKNQSHRALKNLDWLHNNMPPYFFVTMREDISTIVNLASLLHELSHERKLFLKDTEKTLILACPDIPGSLYNSLKTLQEREISYAELTHSYENIPGVRRPLEIQKFEFARKSHKEIAEAGELHLPMSMEKAVASAMKSLYPDYNFRDMKKNLHLLYLNNETYMRISPPERIARALWLYRQGKIHDGLYLSVEKAEHRSPSKESRLLFSVGNPPQRGFMAQVSEVFQRLDIGVCRSYSLIISTGVHPYFLGTFYVSPHAGGYVEKDSDLFNKLKTELYNTQILSMFSATYKNFVAEDIMTGAEASLTNAFIAFCHTSLAHSQPDRFSMEVVRSAFHSDPHMTFELINAFKGKFDPDRKERERIFKERFLKIEGAISSYNTGHRYLDELRRPIFRTCLAFIRHTLKTNFFVSEKHALAFRLDPEYLSELGTDFTSDLPQVTPFRITFFFSRYGIGYHIGFSDIARGGWRTIVCKDQDEYITNTNDLFREVFVLAHTQHLKNKDIYEGGSKLAVVLDAEDCHTDDLCTQRLYKLQYGFINAFLDIFVTEEGKAKNKRVIDYYGEEESIELGPDENMHDNMIEHIARQSADRGYILGIGIMSSKHVGINHKEYGVTSRGVMKFAQVAMKTIGIDMSRDPFTVKITGGTNGDVAGNSLRLLLERCPRSKILCIVAGTGALYDPEGIDKSALSRLILRGDVVDFDPQALHHGGGILFRKEQRKAGLQDLYKKISRSPNGLQEEWITEDELHRKLDDLIFAVNSDLFLPCGGRPEAINEGNWHRLFPDNAPPAVRIISEGANSYISPGARKEIQKRGVVILRDASANKCGVITSSYEVIANLFMTEKEFLQNKKAYVKDVLSIIERRAQEEAELIFKRHDKSGKHLLYTEITDSISTEINEHYEKLFVFFQQKQELIDQPLFRRVILNHLPRFIHDNKKYRARLKKLPNKIKCAILASEIASMIVYHGGWEIDLESRLRGYLKI